MQWDIGQQISPSDDITYIIEEILDDVSLFGDLKNLSTLHRAKKISTETTETTVFIKCYDEDISTLPNYTRTYKNIIDRQYTILVEAKAEREDLGILKITERFTHDYPCAGNERQKESICFVLEHHEGQTLEQKVKEARDSGGHLNLGDVLEYARQISSVLEYFHVKGLALGLILPSNIWIANSNEVFIINFDITWDIRNFSAQTLLETKTDFCSVDRGSGKATEKTDIYSLGAVLYYTLTGIEQTYQIPENRRPSDGLPPFSDYRNDIPKYIEDAIFKSIHLNSRNRFVHIHDFCKDLGLLKLPSPENQPNDPEEVIRRLISETQKYAAKVIEKSTDLEVAKSPLEYQFVSGFVADMVKLIKYVDPSYSAKPKPPTLPIKKETIKRLPFRDYFYFFASAFFIVLLPSLFIIPVQFPKNLAFIGFVLSTIFLTISTLWISHPRFVIAFLTWLVSTCFIISIASYWNFIVVFAVIIIITFVFKGFEKSSNNIYSSLKRKITDIERKRKGRWSWDIFTASLSGVLVAWALASIFGRAG